MSDECPCTLCQAFGNCVVKTEVTPPPQSFEERVVALAGVLMENVPISERLRETDRYTFSDALDDAVGIILAADGYYIDGECTCD